MVCLTFFRLHITIQRDDVNCFVTTMAEPLVNRRTPKEYLTEIFEKAGLYAARVGSFSCLSEIIEADTLMYHYITIETKAEMIHKAVIGGYTNCVEEILKYTIDQEDESLINTDILKIMFDKRHWCCLKYLVTSCEISMAIFREILRLPIVYNQGEKHIEFLVKKAALRDDKGEILYDAIVNSCKAERSYKYVDICLKAGGSVCGRYEALYEAVDHIEISVDLVKLLLEAGSALKDEKGGLTSPLIHQVSMKTLTYPEIPTEDVRTQVATLLIKHGVDINQADNKGLTALFHSISNQYDGVTELLIKSGANVNHMEKYNKYTPMHRAVINGNLKVTKLLLDAGAHPDGYGKAYPKPTIMIFRYLRECEDKSYPILRELLRSGAIVTVRAKNRGYIVKEYEFASPFLIALKIGWARHAELLYLAGSDPSVIRKYKPDPIASPGSRLIPKELMEAAMNPLPLRVLCRCEIRSCVKFERLRRLHELPFPKALIKYLCLAEFDDIE